MHTHNTKLIDGNFTMDEAKRLLIDLLYRKITYHETVKFSNEERLGQDPGHSEERIKALTKEKQELIQWFNTIKETDRIRIKSNITLEIIE